jgi:hypothetical protein
VSRGRDDLRALSEQLSALARRLGGGDGAGDGVDDSGRDEAAGVTAPANAAGQGGVGHGGAGQGWESSTGASSPAPAGLAAVQVASELAAVSAAALRLSVEQARAAGHTWQELGDVLGVSRQAAFQRFGHPVDSLLVLNPDAL